MEKESSEKHKTTFKIPGDLKVIGSVTADELCLREQSSVSTPPPGVDCLVAKDGNIFVQNSSGSQQLGFAAQVFNVTMTFDLAFWETDTQQRFSLHQPFEVVIEVRLQDKQVSLSIPNLNFDIRVDGVAVPGFVYTVPGTNLPPNLWPAQLLGQRFVIAGQEDNGEDYSLTVGADGAITIADTDGGPIPANEGGHRTAPTTVTYPLPVDILPPPKNVKLSKGSSSVIGSADDLVTGDDFLEYSANDIQKDQKTGVIRTAWCWSDNSTGGPLPRQFLALFTRTADIDPKSGKTKYGPIVQATFPGNLQFHAESKIAINPTNVNNIVAIVELVDNNFPDNTIGFLNMVVATSFDGGLHWITSMPWNFDQFTTDPWVIFDSYGNCFISAIARAPGSVFNLGFCNIKASVDGGLSFPINVVNVPSNFPTPSPPFNGGFPDFPKMSIGPDGTGIPGKLALWFTYNDLDLNAPSGTPTIGFIPVTGLGAYGPTPTVVRNFTQIPASPTGYNFGCVFVNPVTGAVYLVASNTNFIFFGNELGDACRISMWVNPTGAVGFNQDSFLPRRDIQINNFNEVQTGFGFKPLPWQPQRGVLSNGFSPLGFDASIGRLWFCGLDMRPNLSNQDVIILAYSDNEGETWSNQWIVNDDTTVSSAQPTIAVEPSTGIISVGWHDPRNDPVNQQFVDWFGFVTLPPKSIPKPQSVQVKVKGQTKFVKPMSGPNKILRRFGKK